MVVFSFILNCNTNVIWESAMRGFWMSFNGRYLSYPSILPGFTCREYIQAECVLWAFSSSLFLVDTVERQQKQEAQSSVHRHRCLHGKEVWTWFLSRRPKQLKPWDFPHAEELSSAKAEGKGERDADLISACTIRTNLLL